MPLASTTSAFTTVQSLQESSAMQPSNESITTRAFARINASDVTEVTKDKDDKGLFLTIDTTDRPEPEHFIL
jgi:hypothetical protein